MNNLDPRIFAQSFSQVALTVTAVVIAAAAIALLVYTVLQRWLKWRFALPIVLIAPAAIGLLLLVAYPIAYNVGLAFSDMNIRRFLPEDRSYGLLQFWENIRSVFTAPVLRQVMFFPLLLRTMLWTAIQVVAHVSLGLFLAVLLNRPMRMRAVYRTILLFPWAIPQVVAVMAWRGEFNFQFGYFNVLLRTVGLEPINWMSSPFWNFVAINLTNIWLGVPFMTVILLGGLQSINRSLYEAAEMDGAGKPGQFRRITLPLIQPVMTPAIVLGVIWTFNNFNIPFFINQQELETSDILVTALFRSAFVYFRYGFASAFALIIFAILLVFTMIYMRVAKFELDLGTKRAMGAKPLGVRR